MTSCVNIDKHKKMCEVIEVDKLNRQALIRVSFKWSLNQQTINNESKLVPANHYLQGNKLVKDFWWEILDVNYEKWVQFGIEISK